MSQLCIVSVDERVILSQDNQWLLVQCPLHVGLTIGYVTVLSLLGSELRISLGSDSGGVESYYLKLDILINVFD